MNIILGFVLAASLFVATPVFSAETKQYFYCAQTQKFGGVYTYMSGIFIVEDTKEAPSRTLEKVEEYCEKEFKEKRSLVSPSVVITAFNRID